MRVLPAALPRVGCWLILALGFVPAARGQVVLHVGGGYAHTINRDVAAAPLTYRGGAQPLALGVRWGRGRWVHRVDMRGASTLTRNADALGTAVGRFVDGWSYLDAAYGLARRSRRLSAGPVTGRLTAQLHTFAFERSYDFQDAYSWEWMTTVDAGLSWTLAPNGRWRFVAAFDGTVLGYVHRPPYFLASDRLFAYVYDGVGSFVGFGGLYTPGTLRKGSLTVSAGRRLGRRVGMEAEVRLLAHRFRLPEPTTTLQRGLAVHLFYIL